jgi:hypothetical protein
MYSIIVLILSTFILINGQNIETNSVSEFINIYPKPANDFKKDPFLISAILLSRLSNSNRPTIEKLDSISPDDFIDADIYEQYELLD